MRNNASISELHDFFIKEVYRSKVKILVVEDNQKLAKSLKRGLEQEGYAVDCIYDGKDAARRISINRHEYDLVLLDVMLPGKDGIAVCRAWREESISLPVLMLTARGMTEETVEGLNAGADDYLAKPFSFEELLARIRALLRREPLRQLSVLHTGDLALDTQGHSISLNEQPLTLTLKEFMVLEYLMRHAGEAVTRDTLYAHAWDFADSAFSNTVDVHIKNLRGKLHDAHTRIQTIRGIGYKLEA